MTADNMQRHKSNRAYLFWVTLKKGYDFFERTHLPPDVAVCERRYVVNVKLPQSRIDPEGRCPRFVHPDVAPFTPKPHEQQLAAERIVVPGPKMHAVAQNDAPSSTQPASDAQMMGLTKTHRSTPASAWWAYLGLDKLY